MVKLFICHASEDKNEIARPLANALREEGYEVWFDEFDLNLGDCLLQEINRGIQDSDYGIVIFSHAFFNKRWPKTELEGLIAKETSEKIIVLPIWHKITVEDMKQNFPILANRIAETTDHGLRTIIEKIKRVVGNPNINNIQGSETPFSISDPTKKDILISASVNQSIVERGSQVIFRGSTNANPDFLYLNIFRLDDDDFPMKVFTIKTNKNQSFEFPVNTYPLKKGQYRVMIELPTGEYTKLSFSVVDKATSSPKISPTIVPTTQTHLSDQAVMEKIKEISDWIPPTSQVISEAAISGDYLKMGLNAALLKMFLDKNLPEIRQLANGAITRKEIANEFIIMLEDLRAATDLTTKAVDKYNYGDIQGATQLLDEVRVFNNKAMGHLNKTNSLYDKSSLMNKKVEDGYYAGVGTGIFGIISLIVAWNTSLSTQMGQILGAIGSVFILLSAASFLKPESAGQIALRILKNQQKTLIPSNSSQSNRQSNRIGRDNSGNVLNIDSETANVIINNTPYQKKSKNTDEMKLLVAPLYNKSREKNRKRYFMKGAPGYMNSARKTDKDFFEFWEKIEDNQHLGIDYLRIALKNYQDNTIDEIRAKSDPEYEKSEKDLIEKIEQRYHELLE